MRAVDLIRKKRDGGEMTAEEIGFLISGATADEIPEYQISAWLMAVLLRGMTRAELAALTAAMLDSGERLDFSALLAPKVDKHSTGGVGDKTSLVLAPLAAAAGLYVPMISGRGLGHTGGTLDKLEAIPGFKTQLSLQDFHRVLEACGCAMIGQTAEIAPADKKLYALRDVTGTVESPYLICASIMSKKLAEGLDALVLDVKTGSGAFMKREEDAAFLAELMVETGRLMGKRVVALLTDMDQPLGRNVGNALEVEECIAVMRGEGAEDLKDLCVELAAWMLRLGGLGGGGANALENCRKLAGEIIASGRALDKFREMVRLQGGDEHVVDDPQRLPQARYRAEVLSPAAGRIAALACEQIGLASCVLGGGREKKDDAIDAAVGLVLHKKVGDSVEAGEPLCTIHYNSKARLEAARALLEKSYRIENASAAAVAGRELIQRVIGAEEGKGS
ncbi:MAG: thymidine phosphorylase [Acidipila sp.]|nr:thymidine phosphorylase [Acidipila sp.]